MRLGIAIALVLWGCGGADKQAAHVHNVSDATAYGIELAECRDKAKHPMFTDYEACAKGLDVKYGKASK